MSIRLYLPLLVALFLVACGSSNPLPGTVWNCGSIIFEFGEKTFSAKGYPTQNQPYHVDGDAVALMMLNGGGLPYFLKDGVLHNADVGPNGTVPGSACALIVDDESEPESATLLESSTQPEPSPASGSVVTESKPAADSNAGSATAGIDSFSAGSHVTQPASAPDPIDEFAAESCAYLGAPEYFGILRIDALCNQMSQSNQRCRSFAVTFPSGKTLTNVDVGIEPGAEGDLPFIPVEPTFYEEEYGGDVYGRWAIRLLEWGGGKFAAERIRVFDGAGEPMSPLLEPSQFEKWKALRHTPNQGSFFESKVLLSEQCD